MLLRRISLSRTRFEGLVPTFAASEAVRCPSNQGMPTVMLSGPSGQGAEPENVPTHLQLPTRFVKMASPIILTDSFTVPADGPANSPVDWACQYVCGLVGGIAGAQN